MKTRARLIILFLAFLFLPFVYSYCSPIKIYGGIGGGSNIIESTIDGFYSKLLPSISSGLTITTKNSPRTKLGLELSFLYNLKSNYNDYFYYGPFIELAISPLFEIELFKFLNLGLMGSFAPTCTKYEGTVNLKIGGYLLLPFRNKRFKAIILQYEHVFTNGYSVNERILLKTRILIYQKG